VNPKTTAYCSYLCFYHRQFLSAYNHMLTKLREADSPPEVILDGITDSLSYLAQSCRSNVVDEHEVSKHISLALNALIDDTFACYEMTIILISQEISVVCDDPKKAKYCINMDYSEFKKEHMRFKSLCIEAKNEKRAKSEMGCTAIEAYEKAIELGESLLSKIDWVKKEEFENNKETNEKIGALEEENSSLKEKMIKLLDDQISQHPRRSKGIILTVIMFIIIALANTLLGDIFHQMFSYLVSNIGFLG
jgi:hypothetical protein